MKLHMTLGWIARSEKMIVMFPYSFIDDIQIIHNNNKVLNGLY